RELHHMVGETLERIYSDRLNELAPLLGQHFSEGGDDARALKYLTLAGDMAAHRYANAEAIAHYTRALEIAKTNLLHAGSLLNLYNRRGRLLELSGRHREALANYEEMEAAGREGHNRALELASLIVQAFIRSTPNPTYDPAQGKALSERALALARELGDRAAESRALYNLMLLNVFSRGDQHQAIAYGEQALAIALELNLREHAAFILGDLYLPYLATGQLARAREVLGRARELWREQDNLAMLSGNLFRLSHAHFFAGDYDQAIECTASALRTSQSSSNAWTQANSLFMEGFVHLEHGDPDRAIHTLQTAIQLGEQSGNLIVQIGARSELGWVYGSLGWVDRGLEIAEQACDLAERQYHLLRPWPLASLVRLHLRKGDVATAEAVMRASHDNHNLKDIFFPAPVWIALANGELALAQGNYTGAIAAMDDIIAHMHNTHARPGLTDVLYVKARALMAQEQHDQARVVLSEARREAEALSSCRTLWQIVSALSLIEAQQGHVVEARALQREARGLIDRIARHITQPDLRQRFMSLPHVDAILHRTSLPDAVA
ncbi:MAG: tetratricopeptide repeat protein, partial [Chloroflexi bacterium]|nr:tetratricopeptide repeat protein [Chloroflexota bacterium]